MRACAHLAGDQLEVRSVCWGAVGGLGQTGGQQQQQGQQGAGHPHSQGIRGSGDQEIRSK